MVPRKHKDSFRNGEKSMTAARQEGVETWPVDAHLLRKTRIFDPHKVVIFLVDTDDFWLSDYDDWFDPYKRIVRRSKWTSEEIFHLPSKFMKQVRDYSHLRSVS